MKGNIRNIATNNMYRRQLITLAENVFLFKNLPESIDLIYLNKTLLKNGSIAFYYDEDIEELLALPYQVIGKRDIYNRPLKIQCIAPNGVQSKVLHKGEFVIMYDNTSRVSIINDIFQYAERLAETTRTTDVNLKQQKTPRIIQCPEDKKFTVVNMLNDIDTYEDTIYGYNTLDFEGLSVIAEPAPYLVDKLDAHFDKIWADALRLIGISHVSINKKERLITDEVEKSQGGTVASRYSRFTPRARAIETINTMFGMDIEVEYFDTEPTTEESEVADYEQI